MFILFFTLFREEGSLGEEERALLILVQLDKHLIQQAVHLTNQVPVVRSGLSLPSHIKHGR